jgi:catalase (peroxidase I)
MKSSDKFVGQTEHLPLKTCMIQLLHQAHATQTIIPDKESKTVSK